MWWDGKEKVHGEERVEENSGQQAVCKEEGTEVSSRVVNFYQVCARCQDQMKGHRRGKLTFHATGILPNPAIHNKHRCPKVPELPRVRAIYRGAWIEGVHT